MFRDSPKLTLLTASGWLFKHLAGGSKEAFHFVYQAFETLADPEARKRYDDQRPTKMLPKQKAQPKKSKAKRAQPSEQKERTKPTPKPEHTSQTSGTSKQSATASKVLSHDKLLAKLYELLKELTREVRNEVIQKEFTQQQRVLLEKWIVNQREAETEEETAQVAAEVPSSSAAKNALKNELATDDMTGTLSLVPSIPGRERGRRKTKKKRPAEMRGIGRAGPGLYRTKVSVDSVVIYTRDCDLPTAGTHIFLGIFFGFFFDFFFTFRH